MEKLESIYPQVKHIIKEFPGLSTSSTSFSNKTDYLITKQFTWKQFEKYQAKRSYLWFLNQSEFECITKSKSALELGKSIRSEALKWYLSYEEEAIKSMHDEVSGDNIYFFFRKGA